MHVHHLLTYFASSPVVCYLQVILHDLDFNPENDRQAEDRCHRIGQTKAVRVYRLVSEGSVDEDIYEIGERKRKLTTAVLSDKKTGSSSAKKRSSSGAAGGGKDDADGDIGEIGRILQVPYCTLLFVVISLLTYLYSIKSTYSVHCNETKFNAMKQWASRYRKWVATMEQE